MRYHDITHIKAHNDSFQVAILRHPAVIFPAGHCYGRTDVPLAPGWRDWVAARVADLAGGSPWPWEQVWSSPSPRCATVATGLASALGLQAEWHNGLLELDFGAWEGRAWADLPRDALDRWAADPSGFSPPAGESGASLTARVSAFARMLTARAQSCIVVSHGGPLRLLPALLRGEPGDLLGDAPPPGALQRLHVAAARSPSG